MMPANLSFPVLLACYGLCFWLMNKATFLHNRNKFLDRLFSCSYCTGFHTGWIVWLLVNWTLIETAYLLESATEAVVWGFASAATSYALDTVVQLAESWVRRDE